MKIPKNICFMADTFYTLAAGGSWVMNCFSAIFYIQGRFWLCETMRLFFLLLFPIPR